MDASNFVINTIKDTLAAMALNGVNDPKMAYAVCNKLGSILGLDPDFITELMIKLS